MRKKIFLLMRVCVFCFVCSFCFMSGQVFSENVLERVSFTTAGDLNGGHYSISLFRVDNEHAALVRLQKKSGIAKEKKEKYIVRFSTAFDNINAYIEENKLLPWLAYSVPEEFLNIKGSVSDIRFEYKEGMPQTISELQIPAGESPKAFFAFKERMELLIKEEALPGLAYHAGKIVNIDESMKDTLGNARIVYEKPWYLEENIKGSYAVSDEDALLDDITGSEGSLSVDENGVFSLLADGKRATGRLPGERFVNVPVKAPVEGGDFAGSSLFIDRLESASGFSFANRLLVGIEKGDQILVRLVVTREP